MVWSALRLGRPAARLFLYPVCAYYLIFARASRRASRSYLARVLGHRPTFVDVFQHYYCFGSCVLDRVFLLNDRTDLFDIHIHGEEVVSDILKRGSGCILFGAHFGSFEVARSVGRRERNLPITLVMYEENARKIRAVISSINPRLAMDVVGLGSSGSMIAVAERLEQGHFVGILPDRSMGEEDQFECSFLGSPARFPRGPFRMAIMLGYPVLLMLGVHDGRRRYDIFFETLVEPSSPSSGKAPSRRNRGEQLELAMRRYIGRLEYYCRKAPFNWFNFYDFWM
jgi:predicted LPLAT superfamily acyltransferase